MHFFDNDRLYFAHDVLFVIVVSLSLCGWDHVMQGLVQLGFTLMDSFGPKPGPFGAKTTGESLSRDRQTSANL